MQPPSAAPKQVTIVDVARHAGVSVGTASLALNGSARCSATTAARVREAAQALNYLPNYAAKSLRRQITETLALVVPDLGNPVDVMMVRAVQAVVKARGYHLSLISTGGRPEEEAGAVHSLAQHAVDGLILCSPRLTPQVLRSLAAAPHPVCVIGPVPESAPVSSVRVDSRCGVMLALDHLAQRGRRRVGLINGPHGAAPATTRLEGYWQALQRRGSPLDTSLVVHTEFSAAGGQSGVAQLWPLVSGLDALLCANDVIAIGAMRALRMRGVRVPDDVAVVGMDDIPECTLCTPSLTSVSLQAAERARVAAELVFAALTAARPSEPQRVMIAPQLRVRESSTRLLSLAKA